MHENLFVLNCLLSLIALLSARCWALGDRTMDKHRLPPLQGPYSLISGGDKKSALMEFLCCMPETLQNCLPPFTPTPTMQIGVILYISNLRLRGYIYFTQNHMVKSEDSGNAYHGRILKSVQWPLSARAKQAQRPAQTFLYWVLFSLTVSAWKKKKRMNAVLFGQETDQGILPNNMWRSSFLIYNILRQLKGWDEKSEPSPDTQENNTQTAALVILTQHSLF